MTPERVKEIAVAFYLSIENDGSLTKHRVDKFFAQWACTEEGKRLTAQEPEEKPSHHELSMTAIEALTEITNSLRQLNDNQFVIKQQLDLIEERMDKMNGNLFSE